jgi:hypothetical protein
VDALRKDSIAAAIQAAPEEKAKQALDAARTGIRLKRAALRARHPDDSPTEIEARLQRWLEQDD